MITGHENRVLWRKWAVVVGCLLAGRGAMAGQWTAVYRNAMELGMASDFAIEELSGVTYLGPAGNGANRFATIQDEQGIIGQIELTLASNGALVSAQAVSRVATVDSQLDMEGIAFSVIESNRVYVSFERDRDASQPIPGVHAYDLTSGSRLQSVTMPSVWTDSGNVISNRGFESLARMPHGKQMWTGNESALTIDGVEADAVQGTTVRLQAMNLEGNSVTPAAQFAYQVDPIHSANGPDRSGLVELVGLQDGNLLALERSSASAIPVFQSRMYQVDVSEATDLNQPLFDDGLSGKAHIAASKSLVWAGAVQGLLGSNMEGLALGPQLANGNWSLIGVTDNGGGNTGNNVVAFELVPPAAYGDFDRDADFDCQDLNALAAQIDSDNDLAAYDLTGDGSVDHADQSQWLVDAARAHGVAPYLPGDANLDGIVDSIDFNVWNAHRFTEASSWCAGNFNGDGLVDVSDWNAWSRHRSVTTTGATTIGGTVVPEPGGTLPLIVGICLGALWMTPRRTSRSDGSVATTFAWMVASGV